MNRLILLICIPYLLLSCTTMSKTECEAGDWGGQGARDAYRGATKREFYKHQKACKKHGFAIDRQSYEQGFKKGLRGFCTYKSGYRFGLDDKTYRDTCPSEIESEFFKGYTMGKQQYALDKAEEERDELRSKRSDDDDDDI